MKETMQLQRNTDISVEYLVIILKENNRQHCRIRQIGSLICVYEETGDTYLVLLLFYYLSSSFTWTGCRVQLHIYVLYVDCIEIETKFMASQGS